MVGLKGQPESKTKVPLVRNANMKTNANDECDYGASVVFLPPGYSATSSVYEGISL